MNKIDIASVPELETNVGIFASTRQEEVAGPMCFGVVGAILIYVAGELQ